MEAQARRRSRRDSLTHGREYFLRRLVYLDSQSILFIAQVASWTAGGLSAARLKSRWAEKRTASAVHGVGGHSLASADSLCFRLVTRPMLPQWRVSWHPGFCVCAKPLRAELLQWLAHKRGVVLF